jgi:hypothetical protein
VGGKQRRKGRDRNGGEEGIVCRKVTWKADRRLNKQSVSSDIIIGNHISVYLYLRYVDVSESISV